MLYLLALFNIPLCMEGRVCRGHSQTLPRGEQEMNIKNVKTLKRALREAGGRT